VPGLGALAILTPTPSAFALLKTYLKCDILIWVLSYVLSYVSFDGCAI